MGKGGTPKVEVTQYFLSQHLGICIGPPDALLRIRVKEKDAWIGEQEVEGAISINVPELFGGLKKEGGLQGTAYFLPGENDQVLPDALAQRLGRANGADCPGFRGLTSLFFYGSPGFYWTANTPYLPTIETTLRRILRTSTDDEQWYPSKARIPNFVLESEPLSDIEFVGYQEAGPDFGAGPHSHAFALTGGIASTPAAGDTVLILMTNSGTANPGPAFAPTITDYDNLGEVVAADGTGVLDLTMAAFVRKMPGTPDTGFTGTSSAATLTPAIAFHVLVFRGIHDDVIDVPIEERDDYSGTNAPLPITLSNGAEIDPGTIKTTSDPDNVSLTIALRSASEAQALVVAVGAHLGSSNEGEWDQGNLENFEWMSADSAPAVRFGVAWGEPITIALGDDMNPAHIIRECLTDPVWGMGTPDAALDDDSFTDAADTLYSERFGLSMIWTQQASIEDFVQEVLDHIQAVLFADPSTGLLTIKLVRDDYDADLLDVLTPDNADLASFSRKLWGDIVNEIVVTWTNPENEKEETISVQDDSSIAIQGGIVSDSRNYYGVRNASLAKKLAMRDLRSAGQPLAAIEAEVDRSEYDLRPASVVKVTWPEYGLDQLVMRVQSVDYGKPGDMAIKLSLIEDVYGLDIGSYDAPPSSAWVDPSAAPEPMDEVEIITLPLFFAFGSTVADFVETPEYPEVLAGVLATTDSADTFAYELWDEVTLPNSDLEWQSLTTNNVIGRGELAADLDAEATTADVAFASIIGLTRPVAAGFVIIGEDGEAGNEIAMVDDDTGDVYDLVRGVLDTVPRAWPAGTPVWFIDSSTVFEDTLIRSAGETVSYKLLSRTSQGLLALGSAPLESQTLTERPWLPNRPANVIAYGEAWSSLSAPIDAIARPDPWVTVTWAIRNRLDEDAIVLSWTDASGTAEGGQTTTIEVYDLDGVLLDTHDGLAGTTFDVPDSSFGSEQIVELRVYSERSDGDGEFVSLQYFSHWVQVAPLTADVDFVTADSTHWTADEG